MVQRTPAVRFVQRQTLPIRVLREWAPMAEACEKAIALEPTDFDAWYGLGYAYHAQRFFPWSGSMLRPSH